MRLINVDTLRIEEFFEHLAPKYAILSHTWGASEVSLQAFEATYNKPKSPTRSSPGYRKIFRACAQARDLGSRYCWVDTCCIDKTSSAELSEAINSMFRWYRQAAVCMVFLEDYVHKPETKAATHRPEIENCKWFTRGWTLQELIASINVQFYDTKWCYIATKADLNEQLSRITNIDAEVLTTPGAVFERPAACRFSWASSRVTTRIEDQAYSLMGILEVNMPLIYGEGPSAFRRLQQEVLLKHDDPSLFVWSGASGLPGHPQQMIAPDVSCFSSCEPIRWRPRHKQFRGARPGPSFAITTRGIHVTRPNLVVRGSMETVGLYFYALKLETLFDHGVYMANRDSEPDMPKSMVLTLSKVGPGTYAREQVPCSGYGSSCVYFEDHAGPEGEIYILNDGVALPDIGYLSITCKPPLEYLFYTPCYVAQPREAWDSMHSRFLLAGNENIQAYVKIYPEADKVEARPSNFDFFVITFNRSASEGSTTVCLVPQDIWEMYESLRQDEARLVWLTAKHPSSIEIGPGNKRSHRVTRFQVLLKFAPVHDSLKVEVSLVK